MPGEKARQFQNKEISLVNQVDLMISLFQPSCIVKAQSFVSLANFASKVDLLKL